MGIHFVWRKDAVQRPLCGAPAPEPEDDVVTNNPSRVSCQPCQDRLNEIWRRRVEPHWRAEMDHWLRPSAIREV